MQIHNSKLNIKNCISTPSGAVLLTVVIIIIIIGLTGVGIYSLTSTSTFTQLNAQNATKAYYLAESGFRVVASEYNNAPDPKYSILESLHGTTLSLADNAGQFDIRLYPYWFYVSSSYTADTTSLNVKLPGGTPLRNPSDNTSPLIELPGVGYLKLQGKTQLATITSVSPSSPTDGSVVTFGINPGFPYDIQTSDEETEIFLVYSDNTTTTQNISQGGSINIPGSNSVAQILPARNGSFRIYNETNDKMDYTYLQRTPDIIDQASPPTTITLSGIQHQDDGDPSVFPFSVDGASEIYFGRNLAVFSTSTIGHGSLAGKKTVGNYTDVGLDGGFSTGKDTISFEEDIDDFIPTMNDPDPGPGNPDPIEVHSTEKTIELGGGLTGGYGSVWYKGDTDIANCIEGECILGRGIRAYMAFEFDDVDSSSNSKDYGHGFNFALISGANYTDGDTGAGGEYMGYAGAGLSSSGLQPPKMGIEVDTYPSSGAGDVCDNNSRRDDAPVANHAAMVYWGEETVGSINAQGGYLRIGSASPNDDDPEDWSSPQGTISFWIRRNTIDTTNPADRFWGQHNNMEMRTSGTELALDWGGDTSLTLDPHPYTVADKWYFFAITWDETLNRLRIYYGDEVTVPYVVAESPPNPLDPDYWNDSVSLVGITENLIMNSSGRSGERTFMVDGQISDLRYYNTEKIDFSDYNSRLDGNEPGLQSYFPLQMDLADDGLLDLSMSSVGSTNLSSSRPSVFSSCGISYDDNRHGSGAETAIINSINTNSANGDDGYYQVTKVGMDPNWLEDGNPHKLRLELLRPLALADDGDVDSDYDYQLKIWIDCDGCTAEEESQFENVRNTFTALAPQIELTVQNGNALKLDQTTHDQLKRILFGFTQATSSASQDITLSDFELYFLRRYPVSDLSTW